MIGVRETALIKSRCPDFIPNHSTGWGGGWRNKDVTRAPYTSTGASFGSLPGGLIVKSKELRKFLSSASDSS